MLHISTSACRHGERTKRVSPNKRVKLPSEPSACDWVNVAGDTPGFTPLTPSKSERTSCSALRLLLHKHLKNYNEFRTQGNILGEKSHLFPFPSKNFSLNYLFQFKIPSLPIPMQQYPMLHGKMGLDPPPLFPICLPTTKLAPNFLYNGSIGGGVTGVVIPLPYLHIVKQTLGGCRVTSFLLYLLQHVQSFRQDVVGVVLLHYLLSKSYWYTSFLTLLFRKCEKRI